MKLTISLLLLLGLSGCSQFTKSGRQQRAYERYVRKSSYTRAKQQTKFRQPKPQMPITPAQSGEPTVTTETGPQSVSSGEPQP